MKGNLSLPEFYQRFPTEAVCAEFIANQRWGTKPQCPRCSTSRIYNVKGGMGYKCGGCHRQFSVRTGIFMEYSRLPLQTWLLAVYIMRTAQKKISSVQLAKELDVTQKTAWFIQKRIKKACAESGKNLELYARLLSGKSLVELGDAHLALHAQPSGQEHHEK